ncbi:uncharacterized protein MONOS_17242 [Monocercomonoides exilis]|uniref:uncharacterized protein n=1 Tax=Monocercomonoides exilis TaxID=2049356 RepID=UPI00355A8D1B|nr:hypothetical protein MONOS_17242 [Monocercomonoides exilis]
MTMKNAILLLKHVGYCNVLKNVWNRCFRDSSLNKIFEEMIFKEEKKRKEKDEKFLVDLCECYMMLCSGFISDELFSICIPCLLKVASAKDESEEVQKEVEIALFALSSINYLNEIEQGLFLNEIKEIIQYHQEHRNLTRLAYQEAAENKVVKVEDLLNGGAVDAVLEEIRQSMLIDKIALTSMEYMYEISTSLKDEEDDEKGKEERKITKKKVVEKMEEEGYEDIIIH